jgi:hypothetical protein
MTSTPQRLDGSRGRAAPSVEVSASEVQLAANAGLLGRDCSLGRQPANAVAADAEVLGCPTRVEPVVGAFRFRRSESSSYAIGNELDELPEELLEDIGTLADRQRKGGGLRSFYEPQLRR